jgi:hypothetical protein
MLSSPFVNTAMKSIVLTAGAMDLPDSTALSFSPRFLLIQIYVKINIKKKEWQTDGIEIMHLDGKSSLINRKQFNGNNV